MKRLLLLGSTVLLAACADSVTAPSKNLVPTAPSLSVGGGTCILADGEVVATGFNQFGYNYCAGLFNGLADGVDKVLDGKVWGDPTYANDHLAMKWNAAWDACNFYGTPDACAGAWTNNQWNGKVKGGSGEVWIYKMVWIGGDCGPDGTELVDGGYCVWNAYEVILSQGTVDNGHIWDTLANPAGYGVKRP